MSIPVFCALILTAAAAVMDYRYWRIPNVLSVAGWIAGIGVWLWYRSFRGLPVWFWGCCCLGIVGLAIWKLGGLGAGDVKFVSALGGILSANRGLRVLFVAGIVSLMIGGIKLWKEGNVREFLPRMKRTCMGLWQGTAMPSEDEQTRIYFAVSLFGAMLVEALREWWWLH